MLRFLKRTIPVSMFLWLSATVLDHNDSCTSFTYISNNSRTISTTHYEAGSRVAISSLYQSIDTNTLPAFCRVQVEITTNATAGSTAFTEVWLPDDWNGRFLTVGNGGFAGGGKSFLETYSIQAQKHTSCYALYGLFLSTNSSPHQLLLPTLLSSLSNTDVSDHSTYFT